LPGEPAPGKPDEEVFLAFGRVFSGVARAGATVHVLSAAYDPAAPDAGGAGGAPLHQTAVLRGLYLMMGRALERLQARRCAASSLPPPAVAARCGPPAAAPLPAHDCAPARRPPLTVPQEVPAGNVLAMAGLEAAVLKSATLSSTLACRPLAPMTFQAAAIVRVAVEPARPGDMPALVEGLRLLNRADPFVEARARARARAALPPPHARALTARPRPASPTHAPPLLPRLNHNPPPKPPPNHSTTPSANNPHRQNRGRWGCSTAGSTCWARRARCTWRPA